MTVINEALFIASSLNAFVSILIPLFTIFVLGRYPNAVEYIMQEDLLISSVLLFVIAMLVLAL